jgi:phage terminase large subunit GpA-like protein
MDAISDPTIPEILGVFASQVGKTEAINNAIGYAIDLDPGPILVMQPTELMAESWSKDRLAPMLRDTPCLRGKVAEPKSRDSGNTMLHKIFDRGHLTAVGANSAANLSMRPIRWLFGDELDRYPASAGTEGAPDRLAFRRTSRFWNRKVVWTTSPSDEGSRSWEIWQQSDQRFYFVPCPDCGHEQTLRWAQVHWEKSAAGEPLPKTAVYACERCGSAWKDAKRRAAVRWGHWRATKSFTGVAAFHLSALYDPFESRALAEFVEDWLRAQGNQALLKPFVNTVLAEWWKRSSQGVTGLSARREPFPMLGGVPVVPRGAAVLTAGIDVQDDRLEIKLDGWGAGEECWTPEYVVLPGDPATPALWADLEEFLLRPRLHESGLELFIRGWGLDTGGHHTQAAYKFARARLRRVLPDGTRQLGFAMKGVSDKGGTRRPIFPPRSSRTNIGKVDLWSIGVDAAKDELFSRWKLAAAGPGYCHFRAGFDKRFFDGLESEVVVPGKRGRRTYEPKTTNARNEPLDTSVYSLAALQGLVQLTGLRLDREVAKLAERSRTATPPAFEWEPLDHEPHQAPQVATSERAPDPARPSNAGSPPARRARRIVRSNWMAR